MNYNQMNNKLMCLLTDKILVMSKIWGEYLEKVI